MSGKNLVVVICVIAVLAAASTWLMFWAMGNRFIGIDDANIFFSYARNLAAGRGFVYSNNVERVEGFTSLLWVLVCAAAVWVDYRPEFVLLVISWLMTTWGVAAAACWLWRDLAGDEPTTASRRGAWGGAALLMMWCFASPAFVYWTSIALMDTALWSLLVTCGSLSAAGTAYRDERRQRSAIRALTVCVAGAILCRPESMLVAGAWIAAAVAARLAIDRSFAGVCRRYWPPAAVYLATLTGLEVFRLAYFGYPLPNTFYAKVSPNMTYNLLEGQSYFRTFVAEHPLVLLCLCAGVVAFVRFARTAFDVAHDGDAAHRDARRFVLAVAAFAALAPPILTGGDLFRWHRLYQPVWTVLGVLCLSELGNVILYAWTRPSPSGRNRLAAGLIGGSCLSLSILSSTFSLYDLVGFGSGTKSLRTPKHELYIAATGRRDGHALNRLELSGHRLSVGVVMAGGIACTYQGPVVDLMGLNNVVMAHSKGDRRGTKNHAAFSKSTFYELLPDVVWLNNTGAHVASRGSEPAKENSQLQFRATIPTFSNDVLNGLLTDLKFRKMYEFARVHVPEGEAFARPNEIRAVPFIDVWIRRDIVTELRDHGQRVETASSFVGEGDGQWLPE